VRGDTTLLRAFEGCKGKCLVGIVSAEIKDATGGIMMQDSLFNSLNDMLNRRAPLAVKHNSVNIGEWVGFTMGEAIYEGERVKAIYGKAELDNTLAAKHIWQQVKNEELNGLSIRGIGTTHFEPGKPPIYENTETYEVSLVRVPSVPIAFVTDIYDQVKSLNIQECQLKGIMEDDPKKNKPEEQEKNEDEEGENPEEEDGKKEEKDEKKEEQMKAVYEDLISRQNEKIIELQTKNAELKQQVKDAPADPPAPPATPPTEPTPQVKSLEAEVERLKEQIKQENKIKELNLQIDKLKEQVKAGQETVEPPNQNPTEPPVNNDLFPDKITEFMKTGGIEPHPELIQVRQMIKDDPVNGYENWKARVSNTQYVDGVRNHGVDLLHVTAIQGGPL